MSDKIDSWNPSKPAPGLPTVRELMARRADSTSDKQRNAIDTLAAMVEAIKIHDHFDAGDKSGYWVEAYYRAAVESGRFDDEIDPNDLAHRSAGGENANAGAYGSQAAAKGMPEITTAQQWKAAASALGAFSDELRGRVRAALLASVDLVGPDVLDVFQRGWDLAGIGDETRDDDDDEDCDCDEDDEDCDCDEEREDDLRAAQMASATKARAQLATPSRAADKRDARKARSR